MATQEEYLKLVYQVVGQQEAEALRAAIDREKESILALSDAMRSGAITEDQFKVGANHVAEKVKDLETKLKAAEKAAGAASSKLAGTGQALLQTGRGIQDFTQGGIGGVLNNIEGLTMALGGPAGLAGILTVVGVGFSLAWPHIKKFLDSLDTPKVAAFSGRVETLEKVIADLSKKELKLHVDDLTIRNARAEIDRLKADFQKLQQVMGKQTEFERKSGKEVEEALTGPEGREAIAKLTNRREAEALARDQPLKANQAEQAKVRAAIAEHEEQIRLGNANENLSTYVDAKKKLEALRSDEAAMRAEVRRRAVTEVGAAERGAIEGTGANQAANRARLAKGLEGVGAGKLAARVGAATPEAIEEQEATDEEIKEDQAENARRVKRTKARRKAAALRKIEADNKAEKESADEAGKHAHDAAEKTKARIKGQDDENKEKAKQLEKDRHEHDKAIEKEFGGGQFEAAAMQQLGMAAQSGGNRRERQQNLAAVMAGIRQQAMQMMAGRGMDFGAAQGRADDVGAFFARRFQEHQDQARVQRQGIVPRRPDADFRPGAGFRSVAPGAGADGAAAVAGPIAGVQQNQASAARTLDALTTTNTSLARRLAMVEQQAVNQAIRATNQGRH